MTNYPAKLAIIVPDFTIAEGVVNDRGVGQRLVFLNAFAMLKVERAGRGFRFQEVCRIGESGNSSVDLLDALTAELDEDTSIVGLRLAQTVGSLVRVPRGDLRDEACKPALQRLRSALNNEVQDADWLVSDGLGELDDLARQYHLYANWRQPERQANPNMLERQLSAKAQTIWLLIAREQLDPTEKRRAHADYDQWRTAHALA